MVGERQKKEDPTDAALSRQRLTRVQRLSDMGIHEMAVARWESKYTLHMLGLAKAGALTREGGRVMDGEVEKST
ncbi:uncharacterized protein SPSK_02889 [Sporothrix schenckii 1099-18]|uniref:Uncharacterized protein n=1 Tax=Sporothrix schenckii 1099-18 TaxID=1397361 RepID=A0A0F2MCJ5_SPOSC|nr:uncharacterized protein SPSK_02889 [Sporothrix schenckii 1099-18]KJR86540.1 hypothetical protein SPSK_02889 [Sporothrix schenckii 1099-18]